MAKVMLLCQDVIGKAMAGPAIRYWELAKALSENHEVTLSTPNQVDIHSNNFKIRHRQESYSQHFEDIDVVITQQISLPMAWAARKKDVKFILDAYDPMPLENLEVFKHQPMAQRHLYNTAITGNFCFSFLHADGVICANIKQKDLWTGLLLSLNRINPSLYDQDCTLQQLIDIVPFGMSSSSPQKSGEGLRHKFNLKTNDKVVLWGGGIWNWFDPLSVIRAIHQLSLERSDIHLVFMGIKHPNEAVPNMQMSQSAVNLAKDLGLLDKHVFFNYGWTPYEQRQNFLLEADIGISTHFEHLETRYAFRTRMLDYMWAGLPIIATQGDCFADLVEHHDLGIVVPYQNPHAIVQAIKAIVDYPEKNTCIKKNLANIRSEYYWEHLAKPLDKMIQQLAHKHAYSRSSWAVFSTFVKNNTPTVFCHKVLNKVQRMFSS